MREWILGAFLSVALMAEGQAEFEVVSVKPWSAPLGGGHPIQFQKCSGGRFMAFGIPVLWLIEWSYNLQEFQILNKPSWLSSFDETYEILATFPGTPTQSVCQAMPRKLLAADNVPAIFNAIPAQLGLQLVSGTAPVPRLVIDHLERANIPERRLGRRERLGHSGRI